MRVISLVPSLTKTICDFGLKSNLVGVTNFCVDPSDIYKHAQRIGGTKDPQIEKIKDLRPTHVIVNEEENTFEHIDALRKDFSLLSTFPKSPRDVPALLRDMGTFLNCSAVAENQARDLESLISNFDNSDGWSRQFGKTFLYLIWRDPWMAVSQDTYISRFLELLGLSNIIKDENRYPIVTPEVIRSMAPDVIFMSSEPWPFRRRDADVWRALSGSPTNQNIFWIDGKALSWYGTLTLSALNEAKVGSKLTRRL